MGRGRDWEGVYQNNGVGTTQGMGGRGGGAYQSKRYRPLITAVENLLKVRGNCSESQNTMTTTRLRATNITIDQINRINNRAN